MPMAKKSTGMEDLMKEMTRFMDKITTTMKEGFEKQLACIQTELFEMKKQHDAELKLRKELQKENEAFKKEIKYLSGEVNYLLDKIDDIEQDSKNLDIVIDNIDESAISEPTKSFVDIVNATLLGKILSSDDVSKTVSLRNKHKVGKATLIGTVKCQASKKPFLHKKRCFEPSNCL